MKKVLLTIALVLFASVLLAQTTTTVWNPAANPNSTGSWNDTANWTTNTVPNGNFKIVFNVPGAMDCFLDSTRTIDQMVLGDNGDGGLLRIANNGNLTTGVVWSAIGYNDTSSLVVETGGEITFGEHMWVGFIAGGHGTVELNGGTINVTQMTGLGWSGGKGFLNVNDGVINMAGFDPSNSIKDSSQVNITNGTMLINGDVTGAVNAYVTATKIVAFGGAGTVITVFDTLANKTVVTGLQPQAATTIWNPAGNPASTGLWSEAANWTDGHVPNANKVVFNVPGAVPCIVDVTGSITQMVQGDNANGGTLQIANNGDLTTGNVWSAVGYNDTARLVVETGGTFTFGEHMWVGFLAGANGTVEINGGTVNVTQMTGLGWSGGDGFLNVNAGVINMNGFDPMNSIKGNSVIDIRNGMMVINGDVTGAVNTYATASKITGFGGAGSVVVVFDTMANQTVVTAAQSQQATTVWNPAGNAASTGLWSEAPNWTDGHVPNANKVVFNVPGAIECVLDGVGTPNQMVLGDNGPGGSLRVANGGDLTTGVVWSAVGYNDTARLVVDAGGVVSFGEHMWVGFTSGGYGEIELNGGTINVAQMTGLGWDGGVGKLFVNAGDINMNGFDPNNSIKANSLVDVARGRMVINGNVTGSVDTYVTDGKIIAFGGNGTVIVTYDTLAGKTIVTASAPQQPTTIWNPGANPSSTGLWTEGGNWTDFNVPNGNKVVFNVPGAATCDMDVAGAIDQLVMGDNGNGETLRIANGGDLSTNAVWSAIGYNDTARLVVETGGQISFGEHMWIGFLANSYGEVELNGGTINVAQMTGIGWDGGSGKVFVKDGDFNMNGFDPAKTIGAGSSIDIEDGRIVINGDMTSGVNDYVTAGQITAFAGTGTVVVTYDTAAMQTIVTGERFVSIDDDLNNANQASLNQNYPNPFTGATTISYSLPTTSDVQLAVFNLAGQKVTELVNQKMATGTYTITWEANNLPEGIYMVVLKTNTTLLTKKMTLLRD